MKFSILVLAICLAVLAQSKEPAKPPAGVPAGAVPVESNSWRWVDKEGKAWIYKITPFGMMRSPEPGTEVATRPPDVPAEATPVSPGIWRWVDANNKVWRFRETPSGVMKTEEPKEADKAFGPTGMKIGDQRPDIVLDLITVKEEGDSLRFSRPGPFGTYTWVAKKTQLNSDETIVWKRFQEKSASAKKKD